MDERLPHIGIVGSRKFNDRLLMRRVIQRFLTTHGPFTIVSGGAAGADTLAVDISIRVQGATNGHIIHRLDSPEAFAAFGNDFRARAFGRNGWIVRDSDFLVAFFVTPEPSGGTLNTLNQAVRAGKLVHAHFGPSDTWERY